MIFWISIGDTRERCSESTTTYSILAMGSPVGSEMVYSTIDGTLKKVLIKHSAISLWLVKVQSLQEVAEMVL